MSAFATLLKSELKKATGANPWFWLPLAVGVVLALYSAYVSNIIFQNTYEVSVANWKVSNELYSALSCYSFWMPIDGTELAQGIFLMIWPLLVSLPYAWSWCSERHRGVLVQQLVRAPRAACWGAKLAATFVSGALVIAVPYVVNLVACACFAPASLVWVSDVLYVGGLGPDTPLSSLYYTFPLGFCALWTLISSLVGGLWASCVAVLSALVGRPVESLVGSYVLLHVLAYLGSDVRMILIWASNGAYSRNAVDTLDLFSVVGIRLLPGSTAALIFALALLLGVSALSFRLITSKDMMR